MTLETEFHSELEQTVLTYLWNQNIRTLVNYRLPNGRIADIIYQQQTGEINIVEVKTLLTDSLVQNAITKYQYYCHKLHIAAPQDDAEKLIRNDKSAHWPTNLMCPGIIGLCNNKITILRQAHYRQMQELVRTYVAAHLEAKLGLTQIGFYTFAKTVI